VPPGLDHAPAGAGDVPSGHFRKREGNEPAATRFSAPRRPVQTDRPLEKHLLLFAMVGIGNAALDRAYGLARLMVVKADALRA